MINVHKCYILTLLLPFYLCFKECKVYFVIYRKLGEIANKTGAANCQVLGGLPDESSKYANCIVMDKLFKRPLSLERMFLLNTIVMKIRLLNICLV